VAETLGVSSVEGFRARCRGVSAAMAEAEAALRLEGAGGGRPLDWHAFFREPTPKLQGVWSKEASGDRREALLQTMGDDLAAEVRERGGVSAGSFLLPPADGVTVMPDDHFLTALRDRLLLPVCEVGACCKHRRSDGRICGAPLDARGRHARMCGIGGGYVARHNRLRDWAAATHTKCTGLPAVIEQRVPEWDTVDLETGELQAAILDVAFSDPRTGRRLLGDVVVKEAFSVDAATLRSRARRDGKAAADAAASKRRRYPLGGASLVPLPFETGGRPGEDTIGFVRRCGAAWAALHGEDDAEKQVATSQLWQECSTLLQLGNAELILSANGR
jgi:hypothetical protein